jgi:hypothetical protein
MALSRAAAAAARKAAKNRGLQGNRGKDGSFTTIEDDPRYNVGPDTDQYSFNEQLARDKHLIEEFGGQEKYPDIDADTPPAVIQQELNKIDNDIERFEEALEDLHDTNYDLADNGPFNDFEIGLTERQLRDLKERKAFLEAAFEQVMGMSSEDVFTNNIEIPF